MAAAALMQLGGALKTKSTSCTQPSSSSVLLSCHTINGRRSVAVEADLAAKRATPAPASPRGPATPQSSPPAAAAPSPALAASVDPPCRITGSAGAPLVLGCRLFLGSQRTEAHAASLVAAGITHILQLGLTGELQATHPGHAFVYKQLRVADAPGEDIIAVAQAARLFLREAAGDAAAGSAAADTPPGVLVHCAQGASRSAATLAALMMATEEGCTAEAALAALTAVRPCVAPNSGFLAQLAAFEQAGSDLETWLGCPDNDTNTAEDTHAAAAAASGDAVSSQCSSRRRSEVRTLHETVRAFHCADVGDESTIFEYARFVL